MNIFNRTDPGYETKHKHSKINYLEFKLIF